MTFRVARGVPSHLETGAGLGSIAIISFSTPSIGLPCPHLWVSLLRFKLRLIAYL